MTLLPCPECHRHVRVEAAACPFCAVPLAFALAPAPAPRARRTRALVFATALVAGSAAALACGGPQAKQEDTNNDKIQNQPADAGPDDVVAEPDAAPAVLRPDDDYRNNMPYGAPSSRERLV